MEWFNVLLKVSGTILLGLLVIVIGFLITKYFKLIFIAVWAIGTLYIIGWFAKDVFVKITK